MIVDISKDMSYKGAYSLGELKAIDEEVELHTSPHIGTISCDIDDFTTPEPDLPSNLDQHSSSTADPEEHTAIAERLRKIPGFETYSYHDSDSETSRNNVAHGTMPAAGSANEFHDLVALHHISNPRGSEILTALDKLKALSRSREEIAALQVKFNTSNHKIGRARRDFLTEVDLLHQILQRIEGADFFRESLAIQLSSLNDSNDELAREEQASKELSQRLVQTQWNLKEAEDSFYARFSGGVRPGDSDADDEDLQFLQKRLATSSTTHPAPPSTWSSSHGNRKPEPVFSDTGAQTAPPTIFSSPPPSQATPLLDQVVHLAHMFHTESVKTDKRPRVSKEQWVADKITSRYIGSWLDDWVVRIQTPNILSTELRILELQEKSSSVEVAAPLAVPQTQGTPTFQALEAVRRRDFQLLLGYDIQQLDPQMTRIKKSTQPARPTKFKGLVDIKVPVVHTKQYIAMWGRDMAQNASLESYRILHFGKVEIANLVRASNPDPLLKLVLDVRNLEVPLSETKASEQPFMAVRSNFGHPLELLDEIHSLNSLRVQPPSEAAGERPSVATHSLGKCLSPRVQTRADHVETVSKYS